MVELAEMLTTLDSRLLDLLVIVAQVSRVIDVKLTKINANFITIHASMVIV